MVDIGSSHPKILIVDDEILVRDLLFQILTETYNCATAGSAEEALAHLETDSFGLVISDINLGGMSGLELIPRIFSVSPDTVVMMISGNRTIDSAIEAIRGGAFDYIQKPFDIDQVKVAVDRALGHHLLLKNKRVYEDHLEELVQQRTEQLNYISNYDVLTNLPNRTLFEDRLTQAILLSKEGQRIAVLFIGLDGFKKIRDTLGQDYGDRLLQEAANRFADGLPEGATIARFEGDEFAVMLAQNTSTEEVAETGRYIINCLSPAISVDGSDVFVKASVGITIFPDDGDDASALLRKAAIALARAKEGADDQFHFYATGMNAAALKSLTFENSLRGALDRGEFEMYYQPKLDVATRRIVGMEGLIRWHHPELGMVSPADFIPLAEDSGMIVPMGEWIIRTACEQNRAWYLAGHDLTLSVNLSARQFHQNDLANRIMSLLDEIECDPNRLELEVTESSIMKDPKSAVTTLTELRKKGMKVAIDDFGTGYSSLGYLKHLPIDILKIDKSFIDDVTDNSDDAALTITIITLAHNMKLKVVAEGVETEPQLAFLQSLNCDEWQGYLFSKPVPAREFEKLLAAEKPAGHADG